MIAWFTRNGVAANLLMLFIVGFGIYSVSERIPLEVFPNFELDAVYINIPYRGATPEEAEEGVVLRVEEAIHDLEGIDQINGIAAEGSAQISAEIEAGYDPRNLLDDIKNRVDAISTFPAEVERPIYSLAQFRREVISVAVAGNASELALREIGERVRDDLTNLPGVTQVNLDGVRNYEISIEVSPNMLEAHGLTLAEVGEAIRRSSLDLSAGEVRTDGGDFLVRTRGQAYTRDEFEDVVVLSRPDGTHLTLKDIATVRDGFEETPLAGRFNGKPGVLIEIYRVGDQSAIDIADAVKNYVAESQSWLPAGFEMAYWRDQSRIVKARLGTLTRSAIQGGILIFLLLALFLRMSVALWVCIGIPVSFMGALVVMPELGASINIISLFAFIVVLGIVVDDAIVTGENIYSHLQNEKDSTMAAIRGTEEVAVPVTFGVLTTAAAFLPLYFIEGVRGQLFAQIPIVAISALLFSLVESKLILPSHMKHVRAYHDDPEKHSGFVRWQQRFANGFEALIVRRYKPLLQAALKARYTTWALFAAALIISIALVASGTLRFVFFPRVQSEIARASLIMNPGTPFEQTEAQVQRMLEAAQSLQDEYIDPLTGESIIINILSTTGYAGSGTRGAHTGRVMFEIVSPEQRSLQITSSELVREWRQLIGVIPGAQEVSYRAEIGRGGAPLEVRLQGNDLKALDTIAKQVAERMQQYAGVFDINSSSGNGKEQIELRLKPQAELLGISLEQLARQVRGAVFGLEAQRIQRGRDDVRVMVRYPEAERDSLADLQQMRIRTPTGAEVPLGEVAEVSYGRSDDSITRVDRRRIVNISADVDKESADIEAIKADLLAYAQELVSAHPGMDAKLTGEAEEQAESFGSLKTGLWFVLAVIYVLLAIPFKSYGQPLMVMSVIPFGIIGALFGHMLLGFDLSLISFMGMLALIGVVVNDSLVLVDYVNKRRLEGMALFDAVSRAGVARFRAVMLTSLTTFAGLMPLIFEKSTQAQFLKPMAISLGFGILFATAITLILIPVNYMILEDIKGLFSRRPQEATDQAS